ncbi:unnamed protein product [Gemmata massiliana]|uniref:Uncharacterized protein n=1 Tax=Gemmata massiliana TaxID=1210884 RepID=A0A6P2CS76_9BACT|nr:hypothetical protein [Gemmata massiliana]VTR91771.1 unnamed protein product [Gemmata massiliana]
MRRLTASALFALTLCATTISAQPPNPEPQPKALGDKADKKPTDPADAGISAALANDADVKMAKAKIQLAEAELAKARQVVTLKVLTLKAKIDQLRSELVAAEERVKATKGMVDKGTLPQAPLLIEREKLATAKTALALAEAEWKLLTGSDSDKLTARVVDLVALDELLNTRKRNAELEARIANRAILELQKKLVGAVPDQIRAALDKPVKLGAKGERVPFEKALEVFKKEAGLDVPVRGFPTAIFDPVTGRQLLEPTGQPRTIGITSQGETLPVGAWFQLLQDENRGAFYVREYGLLFATTAPPDAPTLTEFWKQKPAAKPEPESEPKPEPKPKTEQK